MHKILLAIVMTITLLFGHGVYADKGEQSQTDKSKPTQTIPKEQWADLLKKLDKSEANAEDQKGNMSIILIDKDGKRSMRSAIFFQKGTDRRIVQFKSPANVAGLSVLIRGDDIHLYLPQFRRTRRIASHVKNQPFMGTDLSFDDLGSIQYSNAYDVTNAQLLADGKYQLELRPKSNASKQYSKLLVTMSEKHTLLSILYFDDKGQNIKRMDRSDFRNQKGYVFPYEIKYCDVLRKHCTIVRMEEVKINTRIRESFFSTRYLRRDLDID
jgi:outer membrane lipoprotein-sorting protein